jgi:glycosyltransferase involved in cell wall biosynthesis
MRILFVYVTRTGGVATYIKEISAELNKIGVEVQEITRNEDLRTASFGKSYLKLKRLAEIWSKEFDIIHAHDWSICYPLLKIKNLVCTFHGFGTNPLAKAFENYCIWRLGKRAIVVSPRMKAKFPRATAIMEGVDLVAFRPFKKKPVYDVGICQAYNSSKISKAVKELGLTLNIAKGVPHKNMPKFYNSINTFVSLPPRTAGFNLAWLEAMACNKKVIGSNFGVGELLPIDKIGVRPSVSEIKRVINKAKQTNYRSWLKNNNFTWDKHVETLLEIYKNEI